METADGPGCPPETAEPARLSARQTGGSCNDTHTEYHDSTQVSHRLHDGNVFCMYPLNRSPAAPTPRHLDLSGAPLALQIVSADHTDGLPAAIDGVCNVLYDGFTCGDSSGITQPLTESFRAVQV